jgi:hypothetical protein
MYVCVEQVQGHSQESGRIEALEHALTSAKKDASTLHHAQAEAAILQVLGLLAFLVQKYKN